MKRDEKVFKIARKILRDLKPFCNRIKIVGSIRRHEKHPSDIDMVLIYKDKEKLENFLRKRGRFVQGGEHESTWNISGVKLELYYTTPKEWGAELLAYSSRKGSGIGLRMVAKRKGLKLSQHGLFRKEKRVAGKTEEEIYKALGRKWKSPEKR